MQAEGYKRNLLMLSIVPVVEIGRLLYLILSYFFYLSYMKFSYKYWLAVASGIVMFLVLLFLNPFNVNEEAVKVLAVGGLMITWWIVETSSMPVIALLPLVLFPLLGIATIEEATTPYANPVIFLFL